MKKTIILAACLLPFASLTGCCRCEAEPIVEQNRKLIVPPNFGQMPKN